MPWTAAAAQVVYVISASFLIYPRSFWQSEPKGLSDPENVSIPLHLRAINCFFFYSVKLFLDLNILPDIYGSNEFLSLIMHENTSHCFKLPVR